MAAYRSLKVRRGKRSTAENEHIILEKGELFFEVPEDGVGTGNGKIKIGDGETEYSKSPYFLGDKEYELATQESDGLMDPEDKFKLENLNPNNGTLTIYQGDSMLGSFSANQEYDSSIYFKTPLKDETKIPNVCYDIDLKAIYYKKGNNKIIWKEAGTDVRYLVKNGVIVGKDTMLCIGADQSTSIVRKIKQTEGGLVFAIESGSNNIVLGISNNSVTFYTTKHFNPYYENKVGIRLYLRGGSMPATITGCPVRIVGSLITWSSDTDYSIEYKEKGNSGSTDGSIEPVDPDGSIEPVDPTTPIDPRKSKLFIIDNPFNEGDDINAVTIDFGGGGDVEYVIQDLFIYKKG